MAAARVYQAAGYAGLVQDAYLNKQFIKFLRKKLVMIPLGVRSDIGENQGRTCRWNFFNAPTTAITNLTGNTTNEGLVPAIGTGYTLTSVTATMTEFNNYMDYSKVFQLITQAGSLDQVAQVMAYEASFSLDTKTIQDVDGTTNTLDSGAALTADFVRQAVLALENADVEAHPAAAGKAKFIGVLSAEAAYDMMGEGSPAWFQAKSTDFQAALTTPWDETTATSALYNVLFKLSNNIKVVSSNDQNLILGNEAFGISSLASDANAPRIINTTPEMLVSNPIRNNGTIGWWAYFASVLIHSARVVCIFSDAGVHTNSDATFVSA